MKLHISRYGAFVFSLGKLLFRLRRPAILVYRTVQGEIQSVVCIGLKYVEMENGRFAHSRSVSGGK